MTVYVDDEMEWPLGMVRGAERVRYWCHMWADTLDELHDMADRIGMKRSWLQGPPDHRLTHYDLSRTRRRLAIELGAQVVEITMEHLIKMKMLAAEAQARA